MAHSQNNIRALEKYFPILPEIIDIGFPTAGKFASLARSGPRVYTSSLIFDIAFPFLRPLFSCYINQWGFNFLETNDPLFWTDLLDQ